ncbi:MAG: mandelate racemase/muconate lactonizing enzyme family protein [Blastocatellia bacterium]|nr:mandelate racemase/muconate lactonizing enzyme family protein [Blastocatellia bacterium]
MKRRELMKWGGALAVAAGSGLSGALAQSPEVARSRVGTSPLRITKIEPFVIRTPNDATPPEELIVMPPVGNATGGVGLTNRLDHASPSRFRGYTQAVLVKVTTDQGLIGWGECHAPAAPRVHQTMIRDMLAPFLIGQDARNVEVLWERMYSSERLRGYSTAPFTEAIAGIDLALWDLLGKFTGQPLYVLLGGKYRDTVPTYLGISSASAEELTEKALRAVEQGYTAMKTELGKGPNSRGLDRLAAVTRAIKGRAQLLLDSLGAFKLHEAELLGRELDQMGGIGWWEDALMPEDTSGYPRLAAALATPICVGEGYSNRFQFRDLFAVKGCDMINPDVCRAGGVTECKRIAALADVHGVLWSPHVSTGSAPYIAASLHLAVSTANFVIIEGGDKTAGPFGNALLKEPLEFKPGAARVPERPGLGIEFNEKELAKVIVS